MNKTILLATVVAIFGLTGCEVKQTQKGALPDVDVDAKAGQLPGYDVKVTKTKEGKMPDVNVDVNAGTLPEYEINGPEVTVGTQQKTVKVPTGVKVNTEDKTITLPDVDIDFPGGDDPQKD